MIFIAFFVSCLVFENRMTPLEVLGHGPTLALCGVDHTISYRRCLLGYFFTILEFRWSLALVLLQGPARGPTPLRGEGRRFVRFVIITEQLPLSVTRKKKPPSRCTGESAQF